MPTDGNEAEWLTRKLRIDSRAFAGKLVPQDPADEPAEKLLERIRRKGINNS
jgi:hypothetical protein